MLGYAATTDVRDVPIVVADADRSAASRELVARFDASPNFTVVAVVSGVNEVDPYLERGRGVDGAGDSRRLRRGAGRGAAADGAGDRRRQRRELERTSRSATRRT